MKSKAMKLKQTIELLKNRKERVVCDWVKAKKISLTEGTEFTESIDFIDSFLSVLCEKIMLLHNPKLFYSLILLHFFGSFSGFMFLSPTGVKWKDKLYDRFPQVKLKMNPNFGGNLTQDAVLNSAKEASNAWSSGKTKARLFLSFVGQTSSSPVGLDMNLCINPNRETTKNLDNIVYAQNSEDPDCTGVACSFVWYCNGTVGEEEIVHFDIQVNTRDYPFETGIAAPDAYNLKTVLLKQLGYVIGFFTCPPGNMSCPVTGNGITPDQNSVMYKFLKPGVHKTSISSDDALGVRTLYGELSSAELDLLVKKDEFNDLVESFCVAPCVMPDEEANDKYKTKELERFAWNDYLQQRIAKNLETKEGKLLTYREFEKSYMDSYRMTGISAEQYMLDSMKHSNIYLTDMPKEFMDSYLQILYVDIKNRDRTLTEFKNELDSSYYEFTANELKALIQIRRSMIDEKAKR